MKNSLAVIFQICFLGALLTLSTQLLAQESPPPTQQKATHKAAVDKKPSAAKSTNTEKPTATADKQSPRADRLDLDTTLVTGNRELPKVLYIVPWKKAELGELPAQPFNTLLDEVLQPVDREVFRREVKYYQTVNQTTSGAAAKEVVNGAAGAASPPQK